VFSSFSRPSYHEPAHLSPPVWSADVNFAVGSALLCGKAVILWDGHGHRYGHPRRLTRQDRREDVCVSLDFPVQLVTSRTRTTILADLSADTRAFPREDVRDARVYTCKRILYTMGASLMSVSVSVSIPWNSSLTAL